MDIAITVLKKMLPEGATFTAEFLGDRPPATGRMTRRKVVSNKSQLVSLILDGPRAGEKIHLPWKGLAACLMQGWVYLNNVEDGPPALLNAFVRFAIDERSQQAAS